LSGQSSLARPGASFDADERERALLSAADAEEPSADALGRLQQALGLTVDPSPLLVPRAQPTAPPGSLETAGGAGQGSSLLASKWLVATTASAALVGALVWSQLATPNAVDRSRAPSSSVATSEPSAPAPTAPEPSAATVAEPARPLSPAQELETGAPALRDELARLERARTALRDRRARVALTALDDYDLAHPHGTLREEAGALRIESLFALDEVARASDLARRFLRSYPHSVHGARVASRLEQRGAR
jgi:hypothetical protein